MMDDSFFNLFNYSVLGSSRLNQYLELWGRLAVQSIISELPFRTAANGVQIQYLDAAKKT